MLISLRDDSTTHGVNDVVRPAPLQPWVFEFVIDVPAICLEFELNTVTGEVAIGARSIALGDRQRLIAGDEPVAMLRCD